MRVFVCWSGGKDSALACYKTMGNSKFKVSYLLSMISEDNITSRAHGIKVRLLRLQADMMGVKFVQRATSWKDYEEKFKELLLKLKDEDIRGGIFGDISIREHREWVKKVCSEVKIEPIFPLWKRPEESLLKEFVRKRFKAVIVAIKADTIDKEWLGKTIDYEFIKDLKSNKNNIDLCGEHGEYHTFVYDGPLFRRPIKFKIGRKILKDNRLFLEIQ